ncbi:phosphatidylinositol-specific phospholipase C domain-containing protein [Streptomyces finlayi]|uniref:1-phosphatidylinositol phosphodiesterase n=1 Tax=Streptomyces finlayi TaxID=67296 RepID=A0A7G7BTV1_9ACTN|nr:phosphatidylinositol-specific phospholipase C domain-containing protein [Streptomyces finlayi]QNE78766.1 phosphatidylinositol-specific phospholipase C domain-containing protein [Streptomyces finlayi]
MSATRRDVLKWGAAVGSGGLVAATALGGSAVAASWSARNWMGSLPYGTPLTRLTIPGTHDSCCINPAHGTEWSHTQNYDITGQMERGVRFLDIRCNGLQGAPDEFGIYHGDNYQYIRFQDVLDRCRSFLRANPSEVIVMRVKNEYKGGQKLEAVEFMRRFNHYMDTMGYRSLFWTNPSWPTIGEARGRVVLAADFGNSWNVIQWSSGSNDFFRTQDIYEGIGTTAKAGKVIEWFDQAYYNQNAAQMYTNFTSYAGGTWPKLNAAAIMPRVFEYLDARRYEAIHFGIVPMDFIDFHDNVLQLLIAKNFVGR